LFFLIILVTVQPSGFTIKYVSGACANAHI